MELSVPVDGVIVSVELFTSELMPVTVAEITPEVEIATFVILVSRSSPTPRLD
jgi:hypothetical protein